MNVARLLFVAWFTTSVLQAAAVNIDGNPVFFYFMCQLGLLAATWATSPRRIRPALRPAMQRMWLFVLLVAVGAVSLPFLFAGTPAFVPRLTIDEQVINMNPVQFTGSNFAQIVYLAINVLLLQHALQGRLGNLCRLFHVGASTAAALIFVSILLDYTQADIWTSVLKEALRTNEAGAVFDDLAIGDIQRISGVFSEPSYAGIFSAALGTYFLSWYIERRQPLHLLITLAMLWCAVLTTSFLGFLGILAGGAMLLASYTRIVRALVLVLPILAVGVAILSTTDFFAAVYLDKLESLSAFNRLASDLRSFEIVWESKLLGVGLGSHRASSLLSTVFATTGVLGGLLYLKCHFDLLHTPSLSTSARRVRPLRLYCGVVWVLLLMGNAEISSPLYWSGLIALASTWARPRRRARRKPAPAPAPAPESNGTAAPEPVAA
jgi:hypothetical protein